jgi:hypothetical protein
MCGLDSELWRSIGAAHRHARTATCLRGDEPKCYHELPEISYQLVARSFCDRTSRRCISASGGGLCWGFEDGGQRVFDYLFLECQSSSKRKNDMFIASQKDRDVFIG